MTRGTIQFQRDDRPDVHLEKLRRLTQQVDDLSRQIAALMTQGSGTAPTPPPSGVTMTGPAVLGRLTGTGAPQSLTGAQAVTILPGFSVSFAGLVPSPGSATGNRYLRDDGSWAAVAGSGAYGAPTVKVSLASSAGVASTGLRSDAGLELDVTIDPHWTGQHEFDIRPTVGGEAVLIESDLAGGVKYQALIKLSNADGDYDWGSILATSSNGWFFAADLTGTSGDPGPGFLRWDNASQIAATALIYDYMSDDGADVRAPLAFVQTGDVLFLQLADSATDFQYFEVTGSTVDGGGYYTVPVTLLASGGIGTTGYTQDQRILSRWIRRAAADVTAIEVSYDNSISGLAATNVQGAIDELVGSIASISLDDLTDVNVPAPVLGNVLTFDGTEWVAGAGGGGGGYPPQLGYAGIV